MERASRQMSSFTDLEYEILDEVYFVSSYYDILANVAAEEAAFKASLRNLIEQEFMYQLAYEAASEDYERCEQPDWNDFERYHYVASKKGLLAHNS